MRLALVVDMAWLPRPGLSFFALGPTVVWLAWFPMTWRAASAWAEQDGPSDRR